MFIKTCYRRILKMWVCVGLYKGQYAVDPAQRSATHNCWWAGHQKVITSYDGSGTNRSPEDATVSFQSQMQLLAPRIASWNIRYAVGAFPSWLSYQIEIVERKNKKKSYFLRPCTLEEKMILCRKKRIYVVFTQSCKISTILTVIVRQSYISKASGRKFSGTSFCRTFYDDAMSPFLL